MSRTPIPDDEVLVAYLDGELTGHEAVQVEQRLSDEPELRQRLRELQGSWDALDLLPRAQATQAFLDSTLEIVAQRALREQRRSLPNLIQWPLRIAALASLALITAGTSYSVVQWVQQAPHRQLVQDLPLLENLDLYFHIDGVEFLVGLEREGLFAEELSEDPF